MRMNRLGVLAVLSWIFAAGCGGGGMPGRVDVPRGPMPEGGSYTGVFFSPQYGEMNMRQSGANVIGEYSQDERHGRIEGTVEGNVLRFQWTQRREMIPGRPTITRGRGYFVYVVAPNGEHGFEGEWGHDQAESGGGPWRATKSRTRQPHLSTDPAESSGDDNGTDTQTQPNPNTANPDDLSGL